MCVSMSVDHGTDAGVDAVPDLGCSLCDGRLDGADDHRFVQCYPEDGRSPPSAAAGDGFLAVCADCVGEVDELVSAWTRRDAPPVGPDHSIAAGYRRVGDDCSFCDRALGDDALLGVECYRRETAHGERPGSAANYALCGECVAVFDEFLDNVGDERR